MRKTLCTALLAAATVAGCNDDDSNDNHTDPSGSGAASSSGEAGAPTGPGGSGGDGGMTTPPAQQLFWDAFNASEYERIAELSEALQAAAAEDPSDAYTPLLLGLLNMWALGENERDPSLGPVDLIGHYNEAKKWFGKAYELDPTELRARGWLGGIMINVGQNTGDAALVVEGQALIEESKEYNLLFGKFMESLQYEDLPASDASYPLAVDLKFDILDLCIGEPIDRDNPDYTSHMDKVTTEGPTRICWNIPEAPHAFEGFHAALGELVLKQGKVQVAEVLFANVELSPDYESWPLRPRFEELLASDLPARAALYQDADPENDPESYEGVYGCAVCHATSIPE